jgi:hypothetical protein
MKYLILWDIHWQYDKLIWLLDRFFDISDKVIFLWDYIDKNKDSLKTLNYVIELKKKNKNKVELLWWNHDIFLINSILYKDEKLFETWFYLNKAYETTFFDYVPWNDRVLFIDWYTEFINEYHIKFMKDEYLLSLAKDLLEFWKLYYKDEKCFCIHWGIPIKVINRTDYKNIDFYSWIWEKSLIELENDYKKWIKKSINFYSETWKNDPTWFNWANIYEQITKETFEKFLSNLWVWRIFVWHSSWQNNPKYPKWNLLNTLNEWYSDIWFYYWKI